MRFIMSLGVMLATAAPAQMVDDPLVRPIAPEQANRWLTPQPPMRIFGNTYLVGFGDLNVALIRTSAGLILVDGGVPQGVQQVEENVRSLGFDPRDIKLILSTEPHWDHAGGLAALERDTGATVVAGAPAAQVLLAGRSGPDDPQMAWLAVRDGEPLRLGDVTVTAVATPGHTPGSMSWTWRSCEGERCVDVVFASSLNPLAADPYRFSAPENRAYVAAFRGTFDRVRTMPCDILLTSHPDQSGGDSKVAQLRERPEPNPFLDPQACRAYADQVEPKLDERLAEEAAGSRP
jgi:metallo-beta-lactamase class B